MGQFAARGLSVRYGATFALDRLDLDIAAGDIFVLLGGSGSGKTTLLRCIGGFVPPVAGRVLLDGVDITDMPPHRRAVNTMFQSYALFPHLNVAANVGFGLRHLPRRERQDRVRELLALVSLPEFGDRRIDQLSGGQQQRVALARSLAPRPGLLLLDEPFSALDAGLREATRIEFLAVLRRFGTTAILVTHDQDEALACADRIGVLNAGRLAQVGTPAELYEAPADRFVAGFVGGGNVMEGVAVAHEAGHTCLTLPGGHGRIAGHVPVGHTVVLAVRPERIRLGEGAPGDHRLDGVVDAVSYRGGAFDVLVGLPQGRHLRVTRPLSAGRVDAPIRGSAAVVSWPPDAVIRLPN